MYISTNRIFSPSIQKQNYYQKIGFCPQCLWRKKRKVTIRAKCKVLSQDTGNYAQDIATEGKLLVRKVDWTGQQTRMCSGALVPTIWAIWAKAVMGFHPGDYTRDASSSGSERRFKIILIRVLAMLLTFPRISRTKCSVPLSHLLFLQISSGYHCK